MSNKVSSTLYDLIKSLTKSEKRYFKVASSKHIIGEENKYMMLFDYLDSLDEYDESEIMDYFKGEAFLNKFSITKARLYDNILKSLEQYHACNSVDAQIFSLLNGSEVLHKKSLYKQAKKVLRSAEKLALKHHRYAILVEISLRSKKLYETSSYSEVSLSDLNKMFVEDASVLSKLTAYLQLWNVKSELFFTINQRNRARSKEELDRLKLGLDKINEIPEEAYFFDTIYLKNHIYSAYNFYTGSFEISLDYLLQNLDLFRSETRKIKDEANVYYSVLVNSIFIANKLNKPQLYKELLVELKSFSSTYKINLTEDLEIKIFSSVNSLELSLFINAGKFNQAHAILPKIEEGLIKYGSKINQVRKSFLYFQIAYTYFGLGMYNESLKWINTLLNEDSNDIKDLIGFTNLFNLILHYELKNERLLPYTLKSVERYYGKKEQDSSFEKMFLSYFKKILKKDSGINRKELFYDLLEDLQKADNSIVSIPMEYFRFDYWVEAKAKNIAFASMFKS